jgi:tRNA pseudouridine13 synthase
MYVIKQLPEDFVVEEIMAVESQESGDHSYWELKKTDISTYDAISRLARALRIKERQIAISGTKDRRAVTTQTISIFRTSKARCESARIRGIELRHIGYGDRPVHLGQHSANSFRIVVRNISKMPVVPKKIPNLFGEQRFSERNPDVGRALVKKDFKEAYGIISESHDYGIQRHIDSHPNDYVGALKKLPKSLLRLYMHSYQSLLWNKTVERLLDRNPEAPQQPIPLIGFGLECHDETLAEIIEEIMEEEGLHQREFIIREIPELSAEGGDRKLYMDVEKLEMGELEPDELNKGMKKALLSFTLPKGCYATALIGFLFRESRPSS